ncbi:YgiT-type zinc finger protein [Desulfobacterales bacterium HSG2]|nr:YgiT-type zinc finger protein [Desulfobacterales bacterium HSG2]
MRCMYCRGTMEWNVSSFHIDREGHNLTLDKIPAWVCNQCGESFFEESEVELIQDIIYSIEERTEKFGKAA